jgi:uncharacterized membrane protein (Fun14 family)
MMNLSVVLFIILLLHINALPSSYGQRKEEELKKKYNSKSIEKKVRAFIEDQKINVDKLSADINKVLGTGVPVQVGYGLFMGYSSGYCLMRVSKMLAFIVGGLFITMQTLAYHGFMQIDYHKIEKEVSNAVDLNRDGRIDADDLGLAYENIKTIIEYNMPTTAGFGTGLLLGIRDT